MMLTAWMLIPSTGSAKECLSFQDVRNAECNVYCMTQDYDAGYFAGDKCLCVEGQPYARAKEKKLKPPKRYKKPEPMGVYF